MGAKIIITSKELIEPSSPPNHGAKYHKLSFLDQCQGTFHFPLIFLYQSQSSSNTIHNSKRSQLLKQSLAIALTRFNHLAGRLKGNVSVDCNNAGAMLVEAQVSATLHEAIQNAPTDELNRYLPLEPYVVRDNPEDDVPLLVIQVSFFACGGMAIGVCISHKVADIASLLTFVNYWAALSRGEDIDADQLLQPSVDLACQLFPGVPEDSPFPSSLPFVEKEKLACKRFLFDKEKLAALKEQASSEDLFGLQMKDPTRVEALLAFIWKQFISVSEAKGDKKSVFQAAVAVNFRPRMKGLLLDNVFGNLITLVPAFSMSLVSGHHYQQLVRMLRTAIRRTNDDFIKIVQSGVPHLTAISEAGRLLPDPQEMGSCYFSSWCRFPMYGVDYGWGKPIAVCTTAVLIGYTVILTDTRCGDGILAWITLPKEDMAMLPDELLSLETNTYF